MRSQLLTHKHSALLRVLDDYGVCVCEQCVLDDYCYKLIDIVDIYIVQCSSSSVLIQLIYNIIYIYRMPFSAAQFPFE